MFTDFRRKEAIGDIYSTAGERPHGDTFCTGENAAGVAASSVLLFCRASFTKHKMED